MTNIASTPSTDPESVALDLIVRTAEAIGATALHAVLQHLAGVL
ncbi:hypothetical protein [Mycolicibacterium fortuitum]|nr:hypothetical protein [Mycolicibacterium fortuitum]